ncbi:glycosyltransferase [Synechococcus sp. RS9902]|uniref:rhamnosyltransferase WsaF family glycosyltransferase n=1 Tax=Synechococcus sp. RS9902 TaxID=221345 RepID=UPI0016454031|nr:glycosyltransferase [Synechococcus sp. RS9902]
MASARELVLWMLEAGHTPQHLTVEQTGADTLAAAVQQEIQLLQRHNQKALASALQQRAGLPSSTTRDAIGLQEYAQGAILRARLQRLNQDRGVQESARSGTTEEVLKTVAGLLNSMQVNTAVHLLCSHAEVCPYSPRIEQALAETAEAEEHWLAAREHWHHVLQSQPPASIAVHAQGRLKALDASEPLKQQRVVMEFDHLLFEECFLTHIGPEPLPFARPTEAAKAFWEHDVEAEALLSPEINPLIWADFRKDSSLQQAARYVLVQKLFHGRCLLEAIANDGGVPTAAMALRCAASFNSSFYLKQRERWQTVSAETALTHYLNKGWKRGLDPSPEFSTNEALGKEPLLRQFGINPLYASLCNNSDAGQQRLLKQTVQRFGSGAVVSLSEHQELGNAHLTRFTESAYFNPKFTWFNASPTGDHSSLQLHWVIPDFSPGGGGHMTIFRMVKHLERQGHRVTIWVLNPVRSRHAADLRDDVLKHYQPIQAKVLPLDTSFFFSSGDAVIATSWQTVEAVTQAQGFKERFYFIQDYEPFFYARGSEAVQAEATYKQGLACICASPWLDHIMRERYGAWSRPFWLAFDHRIYNCTAEQLRERWQRQHEDDQAFHLAVYARRFTERRCVELAFAGLERLCRTNRNIVVHLFGDPRPPEHLGCPAIHHGVINAAQLAKLYQFCDLGISLSATNYSLIPQEMMASGLPVVDLAVESTEAIYPEGVIALAPPSAEGLANTIQLLLDSPETLQKQAEAGLEWVSQFSWEKAGIAVEQALIRRISEVDGACTCEGIAFQQPLTVQPKQPQYKASVVIPTHNAGTILAPVLSAIQQQQTPWEFQCVLIDSNSTDGTLEQLQAFAAIQPNVTIQQIAKWEFQHGHTRNRGVADSDAEFVAFLTQDAIPADEHWLDNLVSALESQPAAAGAFGRHIAHDGASPMIQNELECHFAGLDKFPKALSLNSKQELICADDQAWRQVLHFYSDNNSCLRKSIWQEMPLPCVPFGEDQLWAEAIIRRGYAKVYAKDAVVKHSHHYSPAETYERSAIEAEFFRTCFGHTLHRSRLAMDAAISNDCKAASAIAMRNKTNNTVNELDHSYQSIIAKHLGWKNANK